MCIHNLCFEQNYEKVICHFYTREKSLYSAWACFRNVYLADDRNQPSPNTEVMLGFSARKETILSHLMGKQSDLLSKNSDQPRLINHYYL